MSWISFTQKTKMMAQKTDELLEYLAGPGSERYLNYLKSLKDEEFAKIFPGIIELILAKFQRQDPKGSEAGPQQLSKIEVEIK